MPRKPRSATTPATTKPRKPRAPRVTKASQKLTLQEATQTKLPPPEPARQTLNETVQTQQAETLPHLRKRLLEGARPGWAGRKVIKLSNNTIQPQKPENPNREKILRIGNPAGLDGTDNYKGANYVEGPRAVTQATQLIYKTRNNLVPDAYGVTHKHRLPMQQIKPTAGGQWSGRSVNW